MHQSHILNEDEDNVCNSYHYYSISSKIISNILRTAERAWSFTGALTKYMRVQNFMIHYHPYKAYDM